MVTKRVAVGAVELYRGWFCRKFQAGADFEVKSAVASYFLFVFKTLLGQCLLLFVGVACWLGSRWDNFYNIISEFADKNEGDP